MLLPALGPILEFEYFLELGPVFFQFKVRGIIKRVKHGLGLGDARLGVRLRRHGDPWIRHIRNRLKLVLVDDFNGEPAPWLNPEGQILKQGRQVLDLVDAEKQQTGVGEFSLRCDKGAVHVCLAPFDHLFLGFCEGGRRHHHIFGKANHGRRLVEADGLGDAVLGKVAGGDPRSAEGVQDPDMMVVLVTTGPFLEQEGTLALDERIVLKNLVTGGGVKVVVNQFAREPVAPALVLGGESLMGGWLKESIVAHAYDIVDEEECQ